MSAIRQRAVVWHSLPTSNFSPSGCSLPLPDSVLRAGSLLKPLSTLPLGREQQPRFAAAPPCPSSLIPSCRLPELGCWAAGPGTRKDLPSLSANLGSCYRGGASCPSRSRSSCHCHQQPNLSSTFFSVYMHRLRLYSCNPLRRWC